MKKSIYTHCNYIDYIRVFSICMVIILHCICDYYGDLTNIGKGLWFVFGFVNELCRTGVPLFFMISGFLMLRNEITDIKIFYKKRLSKVFVPFILYDVFYYVTYSIINGNNFSLLVFFKELFNCGSAYHLWFIYSILFLYALIPFIKIIVDDCNLKILFVFFTIVIFQTTIKPLINTLSNGHIYVYLTEDGMFGYLGYMILGYILGKERFSQQTEKLICFAGLLSLIVFPLVNMSNAKNSGVFMFNGGYTINHYIEGAGIFLFFKKRISEKNKNVSALSAMTLDAYFIHVFILTLLKKIVWNIPPSMMISVWIVMTIFLSFLWGYVKSNLIKCFKGEKRICLKNAYQ